MDNDLPAGEGWKPIGDIAYFLTEDGLHLEWPNGTVTFLPRAACESISPGPREKDKAMLDNLLTSQRQRQKEMLVALFNRKPHLFDEFKRSGEVPSGFAPLDTESFAYVCRCVEAPVNRAADVVGNVTELGENSH